MLSRGAWGNMPARCPDFLKLSKLTFDGSPSAPVSTSSWTFDFAAFPQSSSPLGGGVLGCPPASLGILHPTSWVPEFTPAPHDLTEARLRAVPFALPSQHPSNFLLQLPLPRGSISLWSQLQQTLTPSSSEGHRTFRRSSCPVCRPQGLHL